jgi:cell division protease FtsH
MSWWAVFGVVVAGYLLLLLGIYVLVRLRSRHRSPQSASESGFGRMAARLFTAERPAVTFAAVAGVQEAKSDLQDIVEFLRDPQRFHRLGARLPRGVLLIGPPGTGKTLLARAVAGESSVPFFSVSGSEFVEMYVGVGAARVRDLFKQAKQNCPSIIFIDEIDAVGQRRGNDVGSGREQDQTLNQVLAEMDGFDSDTCLVVLAATNRPDVLDPALLRPGRFDRQVVLDLPDKNSRKAILEVHAKGKPLEASVDLGGLAREAHGLSGADLASVMNEAAILAARRSRTAIGMEELEESLDRIIAGPKRQSREVSVNDKKIVAYHEAGHALVARMLPNADPVHKVSIVTRGIMGGYTRFLPKEDRYLRTRSQLMDTIATLMAGHSAEEMVLGELSTGSYSDLKEATQLARKMVTEYGMSEKLTPRTYGVREESRYIGGDSAELRDYGEDIARQIDQEVHRIVEEARGITRQLLSDQRPRLIHLAESLIVQETLEGAALEAAFTEPLS